MVGSAAKLKILPERVTLREVFTQARQRGGIGGGKVPFGILEVGLRPAIADFAAAPHLLLAGDPECGLSTALATLARAIMSVYGPEEAEIFVVDPHTELAQAVEGPHPGTDVDAPPAPKQEFGAAAFGTPAAPAAPEPAFEPVSHEGYVHREDQVRNLAAHLGSVLAARLPARDATQEQIKAGIRWQGRADVRAHRPRGNGAGVGKRQFHGRRLPAGTAGAVRRPRQGGRLAPDCGAPDRHLGAGGELAVD